MVWQWSIKWVSNIHMTYSSSVFWRINQQLSTGLTAENKDKAIWFFNMSIVKHLYILSIATGRPGSIPFKFNCRKLVSNCMLLIEKNSATGQETTGERCWNWMPSAANYPLSYEGTWTSWWRCFSFVTWNVIWKLKKCLCMQVYICLWQCGLNLPSHIIFTIVQPIHAQICMSDAWQGVKNLKTLEFKPNLSIVSRYTMILIYCMEEFAAMLKR